MASKRHNSKSRKHAGAAADQRNAVRRAHPSRLDSTQPGSSHSGSTPSVTNAREPS